MPRTLLAIALALFCLSTVVGCGPSVKDKLAGKWQGKFALDQAKVKAKMGAPKNPFEAMGGKLLLDQLKNLEATASLNVELGADGLLATNLDTGLVKQSTSGRWEVKSVEGKNVVLLLKESQGEREFPIVLDDDFLTGTGGFFSRSEELTQGLGTIRFTRQ